jgi:hypothetical protein
MADDFQGPIETTRAEPTLPQRPHRGVLILVLGILGLLCCFILGIVAWVMANTDLREMDAGRMDPEGRGLTTAGKVCGIISIVLWLLWLVGGIFWSIVFGGMPHMRAMAFPY